MPQKYDDNEILEKAKKAVLEQGLLALSEVADALSMPPTSLRGCLKRSGVSNFGDLVSSVAMDHTTDYDVLSRKVAHLEKVVKRQKKSLTDRNWLKQEVAGQIATIESVAVPKLLPPKSKFRSQTGCLEVSDSHYGLHIGTGELGPLAPGGISTGIIERRLAHTFAMFAKQCLAQSFPVHNVEIFLLGDLIEHSNMRPAQAKATSLHVIKQVTGIFPHLVSGLLLLCKTFKSVKVHCVPGNHGRVTQKAVDSLPDESFEHLLYYMLELALRDQPNLEINVYPAWYFITAIYNWKFLGLHCEDAFSWAGIPWYGIKRLVQDYYMMAGQVTKKVLRRLRLDDAMTIGEFLDLVKMPDYVTIGHFHNPLAWPIMGVEVLANGSISGLSHYSMKRLHQLTPPAQKMWFVHPEHGVGLRMNINLDDVL